MRYEFLIAFLILLAACVDSPGTSGFDESGGELPSMGGDHPDNFWEEEKRVFEPNTEPIETIIPDHQYFKFEDRSSNTSPDLALMGVIFSGYFRGDLDGLLKRMEGSWSSITECPVEGYASIEEGPSVESGTPIYPYKGDIFCLKTSEGNYAKIYISSVFTEGEKSYLVFDWVLSDSTKMPVDTKPPSVEDVTYDGEWWVHYSEPINFVEGAPPKVSLYKSGTFDSYAAIDWPERYQTKTSIRTAELSPGEYEVRMTGSITDLSGNTGDAAWTGTVTVT